MAGIIIFAALAAFCWAFIKGCHLSDKWYESCYKDRIAEGWQMKNGTCGGAVGGSKATEYLSETCIDCPYFKLR